MGLTQTRAPGSGPPARRGDRPWKVARGVGGDRGVAVDKVVDTAAAAAADPRRCGRGRSGSAWGSADQRLMSGATGAVAAMLRDIADRIEGTALDRNLGGTLGLRVGGVP